MNSRQFGLWATAAAALVCVALSAASAAAAERYAVVVSGVSGGEKYAAQQQKWRTQLTAVLTAGLALPDANLVILDEESAGSSKSTAENVRRLFGDLRRRVTRNDTLILLLIGHGTFDGVDAKFNLVGPDLSAVEWKEVLNGLGGRVVVVNTTAASFPFLEQLSSQGRVVIVATDSALQRFTTVFPEYFIRSLVDMSSDFDKNDRVSIWEAFVAATAGVKQHYEEERGQLSTERPLLDDDGDGVGREAGAPGEDGAFARTVYLDVDPATVSKGDAQMAALERQRLLLEVLLEALRGRKASMPDDQYHAQLEKILVELARIARQIRQRS
ncbi:MAG: hypothetical protein HYX77_05230 [Acidobacteria bacterium]|nr:hypothetical protein [Acidobacteriota bacterium]